MQTSPQLEGVSIVILGQFNPAIFQPAWFAAQNLVRPQEADSAEIQLIHPEAAVLRMEWLQLNVIRERFQSGTIQSAYFEPLRDLVIGVFSLLTHTPLRAVGINHEYHFRLDSEKQWHALGHRLAPKHDWALLRNPGLRTLVVEGQRDDGYEGHIWTKIEPSARYEHSIFVEVNDHYEIRPNSAKHGGAENLVEILSSQWAESVRRSDRLAQHLLKVAVEE